MPFPNVLPVCPSTVSALLKTHNKGGLVLALPTAKEADSREISEARAPHISCRP